MKKMKKLNITEDRVGPLLFKLTYPMLLGVFSIVAFNFTDTYFVSRLGTEALAAMGYTFPIVMLAGGIALGVGIGSASLISRTIGAGNTEHVSRYATDSLLLGFLIVLIIVAIGLSTMTPFFSMLGASPELIPHIEEYMTVWYWGVIFMIVPMVGNNCMRATGDMITPCIVMLVAAIFNIILDPIMIFGLLGCPAMGLKGAALATAISRAVALMIVLYAMFYRHKMLTFNMPKIKETVIIWWKVLYIGVPASVTNLFVPFAVGILTMLGAEYGDQAIAAIGVGRRFESLAVMVFAALSAAIVPFVGQNFGAKKYDRIRSGIKISMIFCMLYGFLTFVLFILVSSQIAEVFSGDKVVIRYISLYLSIVSISYGAQGIWNIVCQTYNAMNKPLLACQLNFILFFVLYMPLAYFGSKTFGISGLFGGVCLANIFGGLVSWKYIKYTMKNLDTSEKSMTTVSSIVNS